MLRQTYGPKKPAFRIYRELFSHTQEDDTPTDIFLCKARALLSKLPYETPLSESIQLDMIYELLSYKIRKEISREKVSSFSELLDLAREVEEMKAEDSGKSSEPKSSRKQDGRPQCKYCKNYGHTVDECKSVRKKQNDNKNTTGKKDRAETETDIASNNLRAQPVITCFDCGNPGHLRKDCPKCNKNEQSGKNETKFEFCLINASDIQTRCKNRPILNVEILKAHGTELIDTAAKLSVAGYTLYKILAEKGQQFRETKM